MSMLDRAFVRAYSRSRTSAGSVGRGADADSLSADLPSSPVSASRQAGLGKQNSGSAQTSARVSIADEIWQPLQFDASGLDATYFRVDVGHLSVPRVPAAAPVSAPTGTSASIATPAPAPLQEPRRTTPAALSHTLTAFEEHADEGSESAPYMRVDQPHSYRTPNAMPAQQDDFDGTNLRRVNVQTDEALAFAVAKAEALGETPASTGTKSTLASAIMKDLAEARALKQQLAEQHEAEQRQQELEQIAEQNRLAQLERIERFTQRLTPSTPCFNAVWEVDAFEFSEVVLRLFGQSSLLDSIGKPLDQAVANGLKSILITSQARGAGRTSVAIGMSVAAAAAGLNVVLVDADLAACGLADSLRLEVAQDWLMSIRTGLPLDEAAIKSIEDQLTVLPIKPTGQLGQDDRRCTAEEFDAMMKRLRAQFDLVIVDGSPWSASPFAMRDVTTVDAAIVVVEANAVQDASLLALQRGLKESGIQGLGLVENFA